MAKITLDQWAEKSKRGEVCGILGCPGKPIDKCPHCGNHYCQDHAFVINTPAHPEKRGMTILKIELVEGDELLYKNPYPKGVALVLGNNLEALKANLSDAGLILHYDETVSYRIKPGIPIYILTPDVKITNSLPEAGKEAEVEG